MAVILKNGRQMANGFLSKKQSLNSMCAKCDASFYKWMILMIFAFIYSAVTYIYQVCSNYATGSKNVVASEVTCFS